MRTLLILLGLMAALHGSLAFSEIVTANLTVATPYYGGGGGLLP